MDVETGEIWPLHCGQWNCARCGPLKMRGVRAGIYRACRELGLVDMLTLTLGSAQHDDTPEKSRTAASVLWNAFHVYMRKRGFLGCYVVVPEWHKDGTCHLHVAADIRGLLASVGWDYAAVFATIEAEWQRLGGGVVWYGAFNPFDKNPERSADHAAAYLTKYLAKALAECPPWCKCRYCTVSGGFRRRPWHHYFSDRVSASIISPRAQKAVILEDAAEIADWLLKNGELQRSTDDVERATWNETFSLLKEKDRDAAELLYSRLSGPDRTLWLLAGTMEPEDADRYRLARLVTKRDGSFGWDLWVPPPALGTGIVPECNGHDPEAEWAPGSCHHQGGGYFGACYCFPPWSQEPAWHEPHADLRDLVDVDALSKDRRKAIIRAGKRRTIAQEAIDWARAVERGEISSEPVFVGDSDAWNAGPWWVDGEVVHETRDTPIGISPAPSMKPELLKGEIRIRDRDPDYSSCMTLYNTDFSNLWTPTTPTPCRACRKTAYPHAWVIIGGDVYHRECRVP